MNLNDWDGAPDWDSLIYGDMKDYRTKFRDVNYSPAVAGTQSTVYRPPAIITPTPTLQLAPKPVVPKTVTATPPPPPAPVARVSAPVVTGGGGGGGAKEEAPAEAPAPEPVEAKKKTFPIVPIAVIGIVAYVLSKS